MPNMSGVVGRREKLRFVSEKLMCAKGAIYKRNIYNRVCARGKTINARVCAGDTSISEAKKGDKR